MLNIAIEILGVVYTSLALLGSDNSYTAPLENTTSGKKKAYSALLQCRTFLCRKRWRSQRTILVVDVVFLVSIYI